MAKSISILSFLKEGYVDPTMLGGGMPMGGAPMGGMPMGGAPMGGGGGLDINALLSGLTGGMGVGTATMPMDQFMAGGMPSPQQMAEISPGDAQTSTQDPTQTMQRIADLLSQLESILSDLKVSVEEYLASTKKEKKPEEAPPEEEEQKTETPTNYRKEETPSSETTEETEETETVPTVSTGTQQVKQSSLACPTEAEWYMFEQSGFVSPEDIRDPFLQFLVASISDLETWRK